MTRKASSTSSSIIICSFLMIWIVVVSPVLSVGSNGKPLKPGPSCSRSKYGSCIIPVKPKPCSPYSRCRGRPSAPVKPTPPALVAPPAPVKPTPPAPVAPPAPVKPTPPAPVAPPAPVTPTPPAPVAPPAPVTPTPPAPVAPQPPRRCGRYQRCRPPIAGKP